VFGKFDKTKPEQITKPHGAGYLMELWGQGEMLALHFALPLTELVCEQKIRGQREVLRRLAQLRPSPASGKSSLPSFADILFAGNDLEVT
jgi:hypothetical protein